MTARGKTDFYSVVTAAVADLAQHGYTDNARVQFWVSEIRKAAVESLTPEHMLQAALDRVLRGTYRTLVENGRILSKHPGVARFTLEKVKPQLRAELDRRIMASANLIRLNREAAIEKTLQRFQGWATSVPTGGSKVVDRAAEKANIRKPLASLPFEERRVLIDQGHKFATSLSDILAHDAGALAAEWNHHHVTYPRPEHVARNGHVFLIRDSWAHEQGLVKKDSNGYVDDIERPGEFVYCRCTYRYIYALRDLPIEMLTAKGKEALVKSRAA